MLKFFAGGSAAVALMLIYEMTGSSFWADIPLIIACIGFTIFAARQKNSYDEKSSDNHQSIEFFLAGMFAAGAAFGPLGVNSKYISGILSAVLLLIGMVRRHR